MPFLTARWTNLVLLTWSAPDELLRRYLHPELELDHWNGSAHVSLVAFDFEDTRVRGFRFPGLVDFPEINLRIYVRHGERRGVVFVRELVPSSIVATVARLAYNEPYRATRMQSELIASADGVRTEHRWRWGGREHRLAVSGSPHARIPPAESVEHHFKEHTWGFGTSRSGGLLTYRVEHPLWAVREVRDVELDCDLGSLYGEEWAALDGRTPDSVVFAVGSEVAVYPPGR